MKTETISPSPIYPFTALAPCRVIDTFRNAGLDASVLLGERLDRRGFRRGKIRTYDLTASTAALQRTAEGRGGSWLVAELPVHHDAQRLARQRAFVPYGVAVQRHAANRRVHHRGYPDRWSVNSRIIEAGSDTDASIDVYAQ